MPALPGLLLLLLRWICSLCLLMLMIVILKKSHTYAHTRMTTDIPLNTHTQRHAEVKLWGVVGRFLRDKQQTGLLVLSLQSARD